MVRPDGSKVIETEQMEFFMDSKQCHEGWQRSRLLQKEYEIWDGTAFGASVNAILAFYPWEKEDGTKTVLLFSSCQGAEKYVYPRLGKKVVEKCRENVESFYNNPNLQASWASLILHPVCLEVNPKTKRFKSISIKDLGESGDFLNWLEMDTIENIKDFEQYRQLLMCEKEK